MKHILTDIDGRAARCDASCSHLNASQLLKAALLGCTLSAEQ